MQLAPTQLGFCLGYIPVILPELVCYPPGYAERLSVTELVGNYHSAFAQFLIPSSGSK